MNKLLIADLKSFNKRFYGAVHGSNADYAIVYADFCRNDGNYNSSHATKLYNQYSGEYCGLTAVLACSYADHRQPAKYRIMQSGSIVNENELIKSWEIEREYSMPKARFVHWISEMIDNGLIERIYA